MSEEAGRNGARFVVVANSQFWFSPSGSPGQLIDDLRAAGHDVIDVESHQGWEAEEMRIPGDGHWNAKGHAFVARLLEEWIGVPDRSLRSEIPRQP